MMQQGNAALYGRLYPCDPRSLVDAHRDAYDSLRVATAARASAEQA